jgi:hypothetical protein
MILVSLICSGGATLAWGDWSQDFTQNYPPEACGPFTKMEFFIMPGAPSSVTFAAPTSIYPSPGSSGNWVSEIPNPDYSFLTSTGAVANNAILTVYFTGPASAKFDLDFVLWNGNSVIERQEFDWLGGYWQSATGVLILNSSGVFDEGTYNRSGNFDPAPIPPTILLFAPAGLGIFLFRKSFRW